MNQLSIALSIKFNMNDIIDFLKQVLISGHMIASLPIAFIAGIMSSVSPCIFPLIPGYIFYILHLDAYNHKQSKKTLIIRISLFILGFSGIFILYGACIGQLSYLLIGNKKIIIRMLGFFIIIMGFVFLGKIKSLQSEKKINIKIPTSIIGAPILGAALGLSWTPCIGSTLSIVLSLAMIHVDFYSTFKGMALAFMYCIGFSVPLLVISIYAQKGLYTIKFIKNNMGFILKINGLFLIILGVLMIFDLWEELIVKLQEYFVKIGLII